MKHVVSGRLLRCGKGATRPKHLTREGLSHTQVRVMVKCTRHCETCARCSVFTSHVACTTFANVFARNLWKKPCGFERVCGHHSFHQMWSRHWVSWCACCHRSCEDDEEEVVKVGSPMLAGPFQVCSQCFIDWSLPYSLVLQNIGILSSLFLSETCESLRGGLKKFFALASVQLACHHWIPARRRFRHWFRWCQGAV